MLDDTAVHILGGGIGGTVGAVLTCPLEVIKVRLQSSQGVTLHSSRWADPGRNFEENRTGARVFRYVWSTNTRNQSASRPSEMERLHVSCRPKVARHLPEFSISPVARQPHKSTDQYPPYVASCKTSSFNHTANTGVRRSVLIRCLMDISRNEGLSALFKGLIPTLLGVLPSRGIYFCAYHKGQVFFEDHFPSGSSGVYLCAAAFGSITASSLTNPIWFVKTRLQLDSRPGKPSITVAQVIRKTWSQDGFRGFYRGVSASYVGSLETALNFMIYENIKAKLLWRDIQRRQQVTVAVSQWKSTTNIGATTKMSDLRGSRGGSKLNASSDMVLCMVASAFSKMVAITALYPHGKSLF